MSSLRGMAIGVVLSVLGVGSAQASVITDLSERDWLASGDGALTYDASTGLEWLDLTVTLGNSIIDTEAEIFYGEFRWASTSEIENLLDATISGEGHRYSTIGSDISTTAEFIRLLGDSYQGTAVDDVLDNTNGVSRGSAHPTSPNSFGIGYALVDRRSTTYARIYDPLTNCCWTEDSYSSYAGSWLVRETSVPEPTSIALMGLGLAGLSLSRRKRKLPV